MVNNKELKFEPTLKNIKQMNEVLRILLNPVKYNLIKQDDIAKKTKTYHPSRRIAKGQLSKIIAYLESKQIIERKTAMTSYRAKLPYLNPNPNFQSLKLLISFLEDFEIFTNSEYYPTIIDNCVKEFVERINSMMDIFENPPRFNNEELANYMQVHREILKKIRTPIHFGFRRLNKREIEYLNMLLKECPAILEFILNFEDNLDNLFRYVYFSRLLKLKTIDMFLSQSIKKEVSPWETQYKEDLLLPIWIEILNHILKINSKLHPIEYEEYVEKEVDLLLANCEWVKKDLKNKRYLRRLLVYINTL